MANPSPQEKVRDLLKRLNALDDAEDNTFALARIEREAQALKSYSNTQASEVLAVVAMKRQQYDQMYDYFRSAELSRGFDPLLQVNFSCCLRTAHRYHEAAARMTNVIDHFRDNLTILREAFVTYAMAPDMENLAKVGDWLKKLGADTPVPLEKLKAHCELLQRKGITSEDLMVRNAVVAKFLADRKVATKLVNQSLRMDNSLRLVHVIKGSAKESARLNIEIAELLTSTFEEPLSEVLMISTDPASAEGKSN